MTGSATPALDPFRGYANALRDSLPDAVQVLDAFHVVKLGTQVLDEVRRRCSKNNSAAAVIVTTRTTTSAGCSGTAPSISPTVSTRAWLPD